MSCSEYSAPGGSLKRPPSTGRSEEAVSFKKLRSSPGHSSRPAFTISIAAVVSSPSADGNLGAGTVSRASTDQATYIPPIQAIQSAISSAISRWEEFAGKAEATPAASSVFSSSTAPMIIEDGITVPVVDEPPADPTPIYFPGQTCHWDPIYYEQLGWVFDSPTVMMAKSSGTVIPIQGHRADLEIILVLDFASYSDSTTVVRLFRVEYDTRSSAQSLRLQDTWRKVKPDKLDLMQLKECVRLMLGLLAFERRFPRLGYEDDGTAGLLSASFLMEIKVAEDVVAGMERKMRWWWNR